MENLFPLVAMDVLQTAGVDEAYMISFTFSIGSIHMVCHTLVQTSLFISPIKACGDSPSLTVKITIKRIHKEKDRN